MNPTFRELFKRHLPEPYRSQAIANTENLRPGRIDDPKEASPFPPTDLRRLISSAFPWDQTPEGDNYWRAAAKGEFQTPELRLEVGKRYLTRDGRTAEIVGEDRVYSPESCYRFDGAVEGETGFCWSITGRYESQRENPLDLVSKIVEAAPAYRPLEPGETILAGDEYRFNSGDDGEWRPYVALVGTPFKGDNFSQSRRPLTTATCDQRLAVLEDKLAPVAEDPEPAPVAVDPGEGYRLLEEGELIEAGDEEADAEEGGGWSKVTRPGDTFTKNNWYPVRRKLPARYPTTPLPEGFDRWECRGLGWTPNRRSYFTVCNVEQPGSWWSQGSYGIPSGFGNLEYWEAVKDTPPTYRLLNPGEIIREDDEAYIRNLGWAWEAMGDDCATGLPFDPSWQHPVRRPLKTYEDA